MLMTNNDTMRLYFFRHAEAEPGSDSVPDILGQALNTPVQVRPEVGPGFNAQAVDALARDLGAGAEVIFVGHEPDFSATVSALIGGGWIAMKKGGMARVDVELSQPLRGTLVWLIAPRLFNAD